MKTIVRAVLLWDAIPAEPLTTTAPTIAKRLRVTVRTAQRHLETLRREGLVERLDDENGHPAQWWRA